MSKLDFEKLVRHQFPSQAARITLLLSKLPDKIERPAQLLNQLRDAEPSLKYRMPQRPR